MNYQASFFEYLGEKVDTFPLFFKVFIVGFFLLFLSPGICSAEDEEISDPEITTRTGLTGLYWKPRETEPYQLERYGRGVIMFQVVTVNPFSYLPKRSEETSLPNLSLSLKYSGNFGSFDSYGDSDTARVDLSEGKSYSNLEIDLVLFDFLSFRLKSVKHLAQFSNPGEFFNSEGEIIASASNYEMDGQLRDIKIGLIGTTPEGDLESTKLEIGYLNRHWQRPFAIATEGGLSTPSLYIPKFRFNGLYLQTDTEPIPNIWPMQTRLGVQVATGQVDASTGSELYSIFGVGDEDRSYTILGLDIDLTFSREIYRRTNAGVNLYAGYTIFSGKYSANDGKDYNLDTIETRLQATIFIQFNLL